MNASLWEPSRPLSLDTSAPKGKVHETDPDSGRGIYDVQFHAGHFMCSKCDTGSCPTCDAICDLSSCIGEFYTQECWCRKESQVKLKTPLWWFREYDARWMIHDTVKRGFCGDDCTGALCDVDRLTCKRREEACKPWWWCKLPPPKEPDSFLQKMSSRSGSCSKQESSTQANKRFAQAKAQLSTST